MAYKYITDNNLYNKQTYMYSEYGGVDFLKEYIDSRQKYLDEQEYLKNIITGNAWERTNTSERVQELLNIKQGLKDKSQNSREMELVNAYTKSFEVRKRIYDKHDVNWKPVRNSGFEDYEAYLLFAECLAASYHNTNCLKYYSCMLKVDDTLLSVQDKLDIRLKGVLYRIIEKELDIFYQLMLQNGISLEE